MSKFCAARLCPRQYLLVAPAGVGLLLLSLLPAAVSSPLSIPVVAEARCRARFRRRAPCRSKNEKMFEMPPIRDEPHTRVAPAAFLQHENADPRWAAHDFGAAETSRTPKWCGSSLHATKSDKSGPTGSVAPSCVTSASAGGLLSVNSCSALPCRTTIKGGNGGRNLTQAETGRTNFGHSRTRPWRAFASRTRPWRGSFVASLCDQKVPCDGKLPAKGGNAPPRRKPTSAAGKVNQETKINKLR